MKKKTSRKIKVPIDPNIHLQLETFMAWHGNGFFKWLLANHMDRLVKQYIREMGESK